MIKTIIKVNLWAISGYVIFLAIANHASANSPFLVETLVRACNSSLPDADTEFSTHLEQGVDPYERSSAIKNMSAIVACTLKGKLPLIEKILVQSGSIDKLSSDQRYQIDLCAYFADTQEKLDILEVLINFGANPDNAAKHFATPTFEQRIKKLSRKNASIGELWDFVQDQLTEKRVNRAWYPFSAVDIPHPDGDGHYTAVVYDLLTSVPKLLVTLPIGLRLRHIYYDYQHVARLIGYSLSEGEIALPPSTIIDGDTTHEQKLYSAHKQKKYFATFTKQLSAQLGHDVSTEAAQAAVKITAAMLKARNEFYPLPIFTELVAERIHMNEQQVQ